MEFIHFYLCAQEVNDSKREEVARILAEMVQRFGWYHGRPRLRFLEEACSIAGHTDPFGRRRMPCIAHGAAPIGGRKWEAFLVMEFLLWLSRFLPDAWVGVRDESGYLLAPSAHLLGGKFVLDRKDIQRWRRKLRKESDPKAGREVTGAMVYDFVSGGHARPLSVLDVAPDYWLEDRKIPWQWLGGPLERLLQEGFVEFPWQTVSKGATK